MAEPVLQKASITFILPKGDDKDDDTTVSVYVTTRFVGNFRLTLAKKEGFAYRDTWEDTGDRSYIYQLDTNRIKLSQITDDIKVRISIQPVGHDTVKFEYRLTLVFDDNDASTAPIEITRGEEDGLITLSESHKIWEG